MWYLLDPPGWKFTRRGGGRAVGDVGSMRVGSHVLLDIHIMPQERQIILTSRLVLDALGETEQLRFLAMNDCTSIAARRGGCIGVSSRGRISYF